MNRRGCAAFDDDGLGLLNHRQRGIVTLGSGVRPAAAVGVDVTSGGLLAIGALVSAILLSTAVLVGVAVRESRR